MIHQYQNNGYNIVLDVNSGAVHVVDKSAYDVIACLEAMNSSHTVESLQSEDIPAPQGDFGWILERIGSAGSAGSGDRAYRIRAAFYGGGHL